MVVGLPNINFQGQADVSFREDAAFGYSNEPQPIGITRDLVGLNGSQFLLESSPQNGLQEVYIIIAETWQWIRRQQQQQQQQQRW